MEKYLEILISDKDGQKVKREQHIISSDIAPEDYEPNSAKVLFRETDKHGNLIYIWTTFRTTTNAEADRLVSLGKWGTVKCENRPVEV